MIDSNPEVGKRYAPPVQRNRVLSRRKSGGDKFEKTSSSYGIEGEKNQASYSRNFPAIDQGEAGASSVPNENAYPGIPLDGCSLSEAAQLLTERWAAAMNLYNDPSVDLSERPLMYSGASGSSWGHFKLPHQMDFLGELRRAINSHTAGVPTAADQI